MSEVLIFVNPLAGRGKGRRIAQRLSRRLSEQGVNVRSFSGPPDAVDPSQLHGQGAAQAAIAIGGDGTLRSTAEVLLRQADDDPAGVPPLLVVPLGTANLMARHLGISWSSRTLDEEIAAALLGRRMVQLDAARANGRLFLLMAGVGLDARIVHELDRIRNGPIDLTSYARPALLALQRYNYPPLRIEVDGKLVFNSQPALAWVGNVPEYGIGFPILTRARSDDGLLDVCALPCHSPADLLKLVLAVAAGEHVHQEDVVYVTGRSISIDSPGHVPVQIDGEASGHTPVRVELLRSRLRFIVP